MRALAFLIIAAAAASAGAAETVSAAGPFSYAVRPVNPRGAGDAELELYWDYGEIGLQLAFYTGKNSWAGVDFSIATLSTYDRIYSSRIYYWPNWPDNVWQGNGMAVFVFAGGTPGSVLMPPRYVRGMGAVGGWQNYAVGWDLGPTQDFLFAYSQLYNYPLCDPVMPTGGGYALHSWYYYDGAWARSSSLGYGLVAFLIRATVIDHNSAVAPTSFGRVKAIYH